jgi:hypothetical protein
LTPQEGDLIREAQELDKRTAVFIKAAERRLLILTNPQRAQNPPDQKEAETWGVIPKSSRAELLMDIAKILDEAINNIDDASSRNPRNPVLKKSLHTLADASTRFLAQLKPLVDRVEGQDEREALAQAIENAESVVAASKRVSDQT